MIKKTFGQEQKAYFFFSFSVATSTFAWSTSHFMALLRRRAWPRFCIF